MSQEKVDKYKEYKANKQKIWKKEKLMHRLEPGGAALICALFLAWVGFSFYDRAVNSEDAASEIKAVELDTSAMEDYLSTLETE